MKFPFHSVSIPALAVALLGLSAQSGRAGEPVVHMANGLKVGEVDQDSAIVWTRLTRHPQRNVDGIPFDNQDGIDGREVENLETREGSVPGAAGQLRIIFWPTDAPDRKRSSDWTEVDESTDFTHQFRLKDLVAGEAYSVRVEGRASDSEELSCAIEGSFRVAPSPDTAAPVSFTVVTGQDYHRRDDPADGHKIYPVMQKLDPDFFVHTGDAEYYDKPMPFATSLATARFKWNRIYAMPFQREFHNHVASYFMKDDHETVKDDCWPGQRYGDLTFEQGAALFREQVPMGKKTYRTIRWGKDLQIWLVEGRNFRSPNPAPDGPDKTIWGPEQKQWFFDTVNQSDATFRVLISPTPMVGPDKPGKADNHANPAFAHEGNELRKFIAEQKNMFFICGDRHWQYVSVDPESGLREYSCGPTSDAHAKGFTEEQRSPWHRYLRIKGGFLHVAVDRRDGVPRISLSHYGVDGAVYHQDVFNAQDK